MKYAVSVVGLVIVVYLMMAFNGRMAELHRLEAERNAVSTRLAGLQGTQAALKDQIAYATSDAAVARWAHENHLALPGEIPVVPIQPGQVTPTPTPKVEVTVTQVSNLQTWVGLFVEDSTP